AVGFLLLCSIVYFVMRRLSLSSPLFPYTTLFRSRFIQPGRPRGVFNLLRDLELWSVFQLQSLLGDLPDFFEELRVLAQLLAVGRNHFVQLVGPADHVLTEAALQKLQHDCWRNRCARRCAEQTSDIAFWVVDQGGAEFQGTETRSSCRLNNLYALTCNNSLPIRAVCVRDILTQCFYAVIEVLEDLLD